MVYLEIDIGKRTHGASMLDDGKKTLFKAFSFPNSTEGGESLVAQIERFAPDKAQISIGMEVTGHYWLAHYSFLVDKGYIGHVIKPIQTDGWRKGVEIRKRKTNDIDSLLIADLFKYGDFMETRLSDEAIQSLRTLTRFRSYLVDSIADLKRKVICVLDQVFPEYKTLFSDVFGATHCRDTFSFQLQLLLERMRFTENQVSDTGDEIKALMDKLNSPFATIPGIGAVSLLLVKALRL